MLALTAIAIPVLVLVSAESIPAFKWHWHGLGVSVERGDFLVPAMALCVETTRCWWREVHDAGWFVKTVRVIATVLCVLAALVCVIALTVAASTVAVTLVEGKSVIWITIMCLIVGAGFGTIAVAASAGKVSG